MFLKFIYFCSIKVKDLFDFIVIYFKVEFQSILIHYIDFMMQLFIAKLLMFYWHFKITAKLYCFQVKFILIASGIIIVALVTVKYFLTPKAQHYRFVAISDPISKHFKYFIHFRVYAKIFPHFILF